jgi:hypothetical protein
MVGPNFSRSALQVQTQHWVRSFRQRRLSARYGSIPAVAAAAIDLAAAHAHGRARSATPRGPPDGPPARNEDQSPLMRVPVDREH